VLKRLIANIGEALRHDRAAAEQFQDIDRWSCLLRCISDRIAPIVGPPTPDSKAVSDGVTAGFGMIRTGR
jgi:hypothetical protein